MRDPRILLVDDESSIRIVCRVNLEAAGLEVLEAGDGREALELARTKQPDLVLLDVMMPGPDGWQVAEALVRDERTRDIPVVFLTARADRFDLVQGHRLGAVGYVVKPFDPVVLVSVVSETLARLERGERDDLRRDLLG